MTENLERRIESALSEAAQGLVSAGSLEELGAGLVHRAGLRRRRRTGILAASAVMALGVAVGAGLLVPTTGPGGRGHLTAAGPGSSSSPTSIIAGVAHDHDSSIHRTGGDGRSGPAPTRSTTPVTGLVKGPPPTTNYRPPPTSSPTISPPGPGSTAPSVVTVVPPASAMAPAPPTAGPLSLHDVTLTVADNGRTVSLHVGQHLVVDLQGTPTYPWSQPQAGDAAVLQAQPSGVAATNGSAVARFLAASNGRSTLSSAESSHCHPACGLPSRPWTVTVVVG